MLSEARGTFRTRSWDEVPVHEIEDGPKISRATVVNDYSGDMQGEGTLAYLLLYTLDGPVTFIGLERVVGRIGSRTGSVVLEHEGVFSSEAGVRGTLVVVPGAGTGDLARFTGIGTLKAAPGEHGGAYLLELDDAPPPEAR